MYEGMDTPFVAVNFNQVEENIRVMEENARAFGIRVRPHIKPHKSVELAKLQLNLGASGITCAKLGEAEVMAEAGISDILIAFPLIGQEKMERLKKLLSKAEITTIVNSREGAEGLSKAGMEAGKKIRVLLEVDGGIHRGGKDPFEPTLLFAREIRDLPGIDIRGILYYGGTIYSQSTREGYERISKEGRDKMLGTAELLKKDGFHMDILSGGSSFSSKCPKCLNGITEIRPGHYIFNDVGQLFTGMASEKECALRVVSTVVSLVDAHHAIIDAGSKTLTSDLNGHHEGYGYVVGRPDIRIEKLNEEHGFLCSEKNMDLSIGEKLEIIPNHACVVPNLTEELYGFRDGVFHHKISVDARGKNR